MDPARAYRRHDTAADRLPDALRERVESAVSRVAVLLDDDPVTRRLLPRLADPTWEIVVCTTIAEALEALEARHPVVVMAALEVPGGDGVAFLAEVGRRAPAARRVLVGASDDRRAVVRAINEAGIHRLLSKPLEMLAVRDVLAGALAGRRRELAVELLIADVQAKNRDLAATSAALAEREAHLLHSERMAVLGRLTDGLARGVRPLLAELRQVERELRGWVVDPDEDELLAMGHDAVESVWDIIDDIGRFTGSGGLVLERKWLDIADVVRRAARFSAFDRRLRERRFEVHLEPVPMLLGDARRLRQVVLNLIRNAADATGSGQRIEVALRPADGGVEIVVRDEGVGIAPDIVDRVFDELFTTKHEDGLGLGLSLSRTIVEQHAGTVTCESVPGEGTTFRVWLPARDRSI